MPPPQPRRGDKPPPHRFLLFGLAAGQPRAPSSAATAHSSQRTGGRLSCVRVFKMLVCQQIGLEVSVCNLCVQKKNRGGSPANADKKTCSRLWRAGFFILVVPVKIGAGAPQMRIKKPVPAFGGQVFLSSLLAFRKMQLHISEMIYAIACVGNE